LPLSVANGSVNRTGWTAGAGIEYGFAPNWSGKIEYDYMDFGTQRTTFNFIGLPAGISDVRSTVSVVKAGINYRFGPGPVTARY
jgi:outer membrane immunogenic protein